MSKIELKHACLDYTDANASFTALRDLNLSVAEGEFVSIIGSSGCGKSTILNVLSGIRSLSKGEFLIDNEPVSGPGKNRGIVFQHYSLFPWMTSRRNISFGIRQTNGALKNRDADVLASRFLEKVGLKDFEHKYPFQLSGGMQQRVAIARALAMRPEILLMDEPFGAIDAKNKLLLQDALMELLADEREKKTVVFVTHDVDESLLLSDRVLFMYNKRIAEEIRVPFSRPRNREAVFKSGEYLKLRERIMALFFRDVMENIGGTEVVI
ncbi:MAG: ABC transporter ATP-binding protein [Treponema sp.]|jgi:NitT/TauT family transport system ATP-binding protein|nr:ABC transporter ATP-binding protein [Treponema sp.]